MFLFMQHVQLSQRQTRVVVITSGVASAVASLQPDTGSAQLASWLGVRPESGRPWVRFPLVQYCNDNSNKKKKKKKKKKKMKKKTKTAATTTTTTMMMMIKIL